MKIMHLLLHNCYCAHLLCDLGVLTALACNNADASAFDAYTNKLASKIPRFCLSPTTLDVRRSKIYTRFAEGFPSARPALQSCLSCHRAHHELAPFYASPPSSHQFPITFFFLSHLPLPSGQPSNSWAFRRMSYPPSCLCQSESF